jgi:hypothetical protein
MGICLSTPEPEPLQRPPQHNHVHPPAIAQRQQQQLQQQHQHQQQCPPRAPPPAPCTQQLAPPAAVPLPEAARPVAPPQEDPAKVRGYDHSGKGSALTHILMQVLGRSCQPPHGLGVPFCSGGNCEAEVRVTAHPKRPEPPQSTGSQPQGYVLLQSMAMLSTNPLVALWEAADLIATAAAADIVG